MAPFHLDMSVQRTKILLVPPAMRSQEAYNTGWDMKLVKGSTSVKKLTIN